VYVCAVYRPPAEHHNEDRLGRNAAAAAAASAKAAKKNAKRAPAKQRKAETDQQPSGSSSSRPGSVAGAAAAASSRAGSVADSWAGGDDVGSNLGGFTLEDYIWFEESSDDEDDNDLQGWSAGQDAWAYGPGLEKCDTSRSAAAGGAAAGDESTAAAAAWGIAAPDVGTQSGGYASSMHVQGTHASQAWADAAMQQQDQQWPQQQQQQDQQWQHPQQQDLQQQQWHHLHQQQLPQHEQQQQDQQWYDSHAQQQQQPSALQLPAVAYAAADSASAKLATPLAGLSLPAHAAVPSLDHRLAQDQLDHCTGYQLQQQQQALAYQAHAAYLAGTHAAPEPQQQLQKQLLQAAVEEDATDEELLALLCG
jgi:hypothetical protein